MREASNRLDEPAFPIRTVSEFTGIAAGTLRAWERRYGFVKPERTAGGHRLYSRRDIERLRRAVDLIDGGVSLGKIAALLDKGAAAGVLPDEIGTIAARRESVIRCLAAFDAGALERRLRRALLEPDVAAVGRRFALPLLRDLALRWRVNNQVAEQRFMESTLRSVLASCGSELPERSAIIATMLPRERHEVGLLLFAILARRNGIPLTLLGAGTPLQDLISVRSRSGAPAILLYGQIVDGEVFRDALERLTISAGCPVFVGGPITRRAGDRLRAAGARPLEEDPQQAMQALRVIHDLRPVPEHVMSQVRRREGSGS